MMTATATPEAPAAVPAADAANGDAGPAPVEITIGGKPIKLRSPGVGWHREREEFILARRPDDGQRLVSIMKTDLPEGVKNTMMLEVLRSGNKARFATWDEIAEFEAGPLGTAFDLYRAARTDQPDITVDEARLLLETLTADEAKALLPTLESLK